jgi:MFS family permease
LLDCHDASPDTREIANVAFHAEAPLPSRRSLRALDAFAFFLADVQTGWGPFVAAYLTSVAWSQSDIGLILTAGTLAGLGLQIPAGAVVDRVRAKRSLAAIGVLAISSSALVLSFWPRFGPVLVAKLLHAIASCLVGPVLAAISLGLVGHAGLAARLGRNARFLSLGNAIAAGAMGVLAHQFGNRAIFFLTAGLGVPTLAALARVRPSEIDPELARGGVPHAVSPAPRAALAVVTRNRALAIFAAAVVLFQLANAAMLPIMAGMLTLRTPETATLVLAICILAPQGVVAAIAPWVGRTAQRSGRRPLLVACFAALALRGAIFAVVSDPRAIVAAQLLDGISAATLGVLVPLVVADTTRGSGHFNLAQATVGAAVGIGASLSTLLAGAIADAAGAPSAFACLTGVALAGLAVSAALMPETRPGDIAAA